MPIQHFSILFLFQLLILFPLSAHASAVVQQRQAVQHKQQQTAASSSSPAPVSRPAASAYQPPPTRTLARGPQVEDDVMELHQIWEFFETSSELWAYMVDAEPKRATVKRYIDAYRKQGVFIYKAPHHYVQLIDEMSAGNASLLKNAFADVLKFVAVMEYDFDNGQDKDAMARRMLGEKFYRENKQRLGL